MKVLEVVWYTNRTTTGVILAENDTGDPHIYIGLAFGFDEKLDIQHILDHGTKMKPEKFFEPFMKHLKK